MALDAKVANHGVRQVRRERSCFTLTICELPLLLSGYESRIIVGIHKTYSIDITNCGRIGPSNDSTGRLGRNWNSVRRLDRCLGSGCGSDMDLQEAETRDAG